MSEQLIPLPQHLCISEQSTPDPNVGDFSEEEGDRSERYPPTGSFPRVDTGRKFTRRSPKSLLASPQRTAECHTVPIYEVRL